MSGISKRVNGSWVSDSYGIMKTATDTLTTLPADLYADGNNATIGLKGNMSQTGTPTPSNPIQPQETGERTGNLFDKNASGIDRTGYILSDGDIALSQNFYTSDYISVSGLSSVTISNMGTGANPSYCLYDSNKDYISGTKYNNNTTVTADVTNAHYIRFSYRITNESTAMLVSGTTAPSSYIPHGYKIPISSASTTTPVYLGEVETTRKIKKLVLTGEETWTYDSSRTRFYMSIPDVLVGQARSIPILSTHFVGVYDGRTEAQVGNNSIYVAANTNLYIKTTDYNTETAFTEFLQQQYAAGTPVVVYYVLATPTTGVVNEPLRKIGDYADTVSGITIPTIAGADSFDVLTTLKPSEVTVNYHGWHTGTVHERESGQWNE